MWATKCKVIHPCNAIQNIVFMLKLKDDNDWQATRHTVCSHHRKKQTLSAEMRQRLCDANECVKFQSK